MEVKKAIYIISSPRIELCPKPDLAEIAFIGRSNVGKSSLINMLSDKKELAKVSGNPGKTQMINHFLINEDFYWVDLPGYGFAKVSQAQRNSWKKMIWDYLEQRKSLMCVFVLIDTRHEPQKLDIDFINQIGTKQIPFSIIFTKADKNTQTVTAKNVQLFLKELLKHWDELPPHFVTSAVKHHGKKEIYKFLDGIQKDWKVIKKELDAENNHSPFN